MTEQANVDPREQSVNIDRISIKGMVYGAAAGGVLGIAVSEGVVWSTASILRIVHGTNLDPSFIQSWRFIQANLLGLSTAFAGSTIGMLHQEVIQNIRSFNFPKKK